jgi:transposase
VAFRPRRLPRFTTARRQPSTSGLIDLTRKGLPAYTTESEKDGRSKIDEEAEEELKRLLETSPPEEGKEAVSRWTAPQLARHLEEKLDIEVHPETVRRTLRRLGFSWTRPRRRLPPTDGKEYQRRMSEVVEAIGEVGTETTVLFENELVRGRDGDQAISSAEANVATSGATTSGRRALEKRGLCLLRSGRRAGGRGIYRTLSERNLRTCVLVFGVGLGTDYRPGSSSLGSGPVAYLRDGDRVDRKAGSP